MHLHKLWTASGGCHSFHRVIEPPLNALDEVARRRGITRAEAARQAITEAAERDRRRSGLAAEARRLMQDPSYVSEAQDVAALMEDLRGPR